MLASFGHAMMQNPETVTRSADLINWCEMTIVCSVLFEFKSSLRNCFISLNFLKLVFSIASASFIYFKHCSWKNGDCLTSFTKLSSLTSLQWKLNHSSKWIYSSSLMILRCSLCVHRSISVPDRCTQHNLSRERCSSARTLPGTNVLADRKRISPRHRRRASRSKLAPRLAAYKCQILKHFKNSETNCYLSRRCCFVTCVDIIQINTFTIGESSGVSRSIGVRKGSVRFVIPCHIATNTFLTYWFN